LRELERFDLLKSSLQARTKSAQKSDLLTSHILMKLSREKESPSTRLQGLLKQKIEGWLVESAERASLQGRIDEAIALQKRAEPLVTRQPGTAFRFHLSLGELYSRKGMKNEADGEFLEALISRRTAREEIRVLNEIRQLYGLPGGFLVWMTDGVCHLRWWSDETRTFMGTITSSPPIKKVRGFRLEPDDKYRLFDNTLKFVRIAHNDRIEGIDLIGQTQAQLSFFLKMDGRENIEKSVIILPGGIHPQGMPFVLGERHQ
jgi:hypothetical protein